MTVRTHPSERTAGAPSPSGRDAPGLFPDSSPNTQPSAVPRLYARRFVAMIALQLFFILLLVEGIFLAEKFASLLKVTLENQADANNIVLLLLFFAPEVFDLALPIALLMAVYLVALRCREGRELVILATMGVGARQFIVLALAIGLAAQFMSLLVSGIVEPYAQFSSREILFQAQNRVLRGGISSARFYEFPGYVIYAPAQIEAAAERPLFIHRALDENLSRVITSRRARLDGPNATSELTLHLRDLTILDHAKPGSLAKTDPTGDAPANNSRTNFMKVGSFAQEMILDDLLRFPPRGGSPIEKTSGELLDSASFTANPTAEIGEFGRRMARGLLCLITPLVAGLALVFTNRNSQPFILPVFCAGLMVLDITASTAVKNFAGFGFWATNLALIAAAALLIVTIIKLTLNRQNELIGPALARS